MRFVAGGRIHHVIRSQDQDHIRLGEGWVDLLQVIQLVVGDVGLGEQDVHVSRHAPRHWVDAVADFHAAVLQDRRELTNIMLGLRHRHAVAWDDRHDACGLKNHRRLVGRRAFDAALVEIVALGNTATASAPAQVSGQHVGQRAVHRAAHDARQDESGSSYQ